MLLLSQLEYYDVIILRILQVTSAISFLMACLQIIGVIQQWKRKAAHASARYMGSFLALLNICFSSIAFAQTIVIFQNGSVDYLNQILSSLLLFIVYEEKFTHVIVVIDFSLRTKYLLNFGDDRRSIALICAIIIGTVIISTGIGYYAFWGEEKAGTIIILALSFAAIMQLICVLVHKIYFISLIKKIRLTSIGKYTLAEKHAISKNIFLLKFYLPLAINASICGTLGILAAALSAMFCASVVFASAFFFVFYNLVIILNNCFAIFGDVVISARKRRSHRQRNLRVNKVDTIKTMLNFVPARANIDDHFKTLKVMWN